MGEGAGTMNGRDDLSAATGMPPAAAADAAAVDPAS
jgi:hypothetical protein